MLITPEASLESIEEELSPAARCSLMSPEEIERLGSVIVFNVRMQDETTCVIRRPGETYEDIIERSPNLRTAVNCARSIIKRAGDDPIAAEKVLRLPDGTEIVSMQVREPLQQAPIRKGW